MCGIYGAMGFNLVGREYVSSRKSSLEESSTRRGRDGHGVYEFAGGYLGTSRAQPLPEGEDIQLPLQYGHTVMVFNGTLSNDDELADEMGIPRRDVDTEIAIRLWDEQGSSCCDKFIGGFAFGVFNQDTGTLAVSKNFKTLWYILTDDFFIFASERDFLIDGDIDIFDKAQPQVFPMNTTLQINKDGGREITKISRQFWSSTPDLDSSKALIVISGGIDSSTSAYIAKKIHKKDVVLINFDYGQRASVQEKEAVEYIAEDLGCDVEFVDLKALGRWGSSPLTDRNIELPLGRRSVESTLAWTPGRNMLMLAYAASYAEAKGIQWLYYGNNLEEEASGYSDNDLEFLHYYNILLRYGTLKGVQIKRSLARVMKAEILQIGTYLQVPFHRTYSCDEGFEKPCGICGCCTTRRYAFKRAGLRDGQEYLKDLVDVYPWQGSKEYNLDRLLTLVMEDV